MPSKAEMASLGLLPEDFADQVCIVFPDCWQSVRVMQAMRGQWRVGPGGPFALDYNVLPEIWKRCNIPKGLRDQVFRDLDIMQSEALNVIQTRMKRNG